MGRLNSIICSFAAALACISCGSGNQTDTRPVVAVSIDPLSRIVGDVAGGDFRVVTVAGKGSNPESFDPTVASLASLAGSNLFFTTGALGFERELTEALADNRQTLRIVDLSEAIAPLGDTHHADDHRHDSDEEHHHHTIDPHIWNSLRNAASMTRRVGRELDRTAGGGETYSLRADSLARLYERVDSLLSATITAGRAFLISHPSMSYFARDYGLRQISVGSDNKDLSVGTMKRAADIAADSGAGIYFAESRADSLRSSSLAAQAGLRIVILNTLDSDILRTLRRAASALEND
ncbi:MAG: zinc ABC transporter substrate-binding protein [Clostridium sp.]|nr:zinc ABC transporter substrate-binding protein [Clostridium sp.]